MNTYKKIISSVFTVVLVVAVTQVSAQVTPDTPDKVLLEGKDLDSMYQVARPTTRMSFEIDGLDKPIDIQYMNKRMVLVVSEPTQNEKERIKDAFIKFSGKKNFVIKSQNEMTKEKSRKIKN
jgi:hypothetical protein